MFSYRHNMCQIVIRNPLSYVFGQFLPSRVVVIPYFLLISPNLWFVYFLQGEAKWCVLQTFDCKNIDGSAFFYAL